MTDELQDIKKINSSISIECTDPGCWVIRDRYGKEILLKYEDWDSIIRYIIDGYNNLDSKTRLYKFIDSITGKFCSGCKMDCMDCAFYEFSKFIERRIAYKK